MHNSSTRRASSLLLALALVVLGLWPGCGTNELCKNDADCVDDSVCLGGLCGSKLVCAEGKVCDPSTPQPAKTSACTVGEKRCDNNTLKICRPDGTTWAELDCGLFHICQGGACVRKPVATTCGNGKTDKGEQCDDGNQNSGDGCSRYCLNEKVERWEAPITARAPDAFILGSRRCRDVRTRNTFRENKTTLYVIVSPVVCRENGRPIASDTTINAHIAFLNKVYRSANFIFLRGKTRWEDSADHCEVFYNTESSATLSRYALSNQISVFYARNISGGSFSIGGFANHSGVVLNAKAFKAEEILAHELGHSLGLDHPHACYHGKETKDTCTTTGDELCDTPVDPGPKGVNGLDVCPDRSVKNGACTVTSCSSVSCPGGEKPLISNLMSYYHCGTALTPDQVAALRCVAFHEQAARVSQRRPCSTDAECGSSKCKAGFCESTTPGCTKNAECGEGLRCDAGQCVACVQDRTASGSDGLCCSGERNGKGLCCSKERCCGAQNNSSFTANGQCRCDSGFTWTEPVAAGDFRCKSRNPPSCLLDGMWSATDAQCCNKERDDQGKCCQGAACCAPRNNSYTGTDGKCQCQHGFAPESTSDSNNNRCKKIPAPACTKDGEAAASNDKCCSKERSDAGKCCTGNGCCGAQNNSRTVNGSCQCVDGFVRTTPTNANDLRCKRPPAPSCAKDGESAASDDKCCSKERSDAGKCCTGKECCAPRNNSFTANNGRCQCNNGFTWSAPNTQTDFRCKKKAPPPCRKDGESSNDAALCCSKTSDDIGKCCTGNGCCLAQQNAQAAADGSCQCKTGFIRTTPNDAGDLRCKKKPTVPGGGFSCTFAHALSGHSNLVRAVAISPDGSKIATGSYDKTIKLWDANGKLIRTYTGHSKGVMSVNFSPSGQELASGGFGGIYRRWSLSSTSFKTSQTMSFPLRAVVYRPDGQQIATGTQRGISLWNLGNGGGFGFASSAFVRGVDFSQNSQQMAMALENKTIELYQVSNRQRLRVLSGSNGRVFDVSYNGNGTLLASGSQNLRVWEPKSGKLLQTIKAHGAATFNVLFHPTNPKILFSAGDDDNAKIWDASNGNLLQTLSGHTADVYTLAISRDGKTLVTGAGDNTARVWRCQ